MANRILEILVNLTFVKVITNFISILSLRVCIRRGLRLAEHVFKYKEIAELNPFEAKNLRVCFGFTSNCFASRNDSFLYKSFVVVVMDSNSKLS